MKRQLVALVLCVVTIGALLAASGQALGKAEAAPSRHVTISLSHQALYAYSGHVLVWSSLATAGNAALPTPIGHFWIFAKYSPFEFISPWPIGSPYWYPPSWVTYAMEFRRGKQTDEGRIT